MSGALFHLVSINNINQMQVFENTALEAESFETFQCEFNNNLITIIRESDCLLPKFLLLDLPANQARTNHTREEYINDLINNYELIMEVGGQNILSIPFLIMNNLEPYSITPNNKLKLSIPFDKVFAFANGLPIISIAFHTIIFKLNNYNQAAQTNIIAKLISIGRYVDQPQRRSLVQNQHEPIIKAIHKIKYTSSTPDNIFNINGGGFLNGVILQLTSPNATIANIRKVEFLLNGHSRLEWDADMLDLMAVRLSDNALYINPNVDGNGLLAPINSNTLNLSRFETFQCKIETNLADGFNTTMHFIVNNKVNISGGMMVIRYTINFSENGIIREPHPTHTRRPDIQQPSIIGIQWICEPITFDIPADTICPITHDTLNPEEGIYKCITCDNLIGFNAFKTWISTNTICPLCRSADISNIYYGIP